MLTDFLEAAFTLPVGIFSFLLLLVLMYWALVLIGALELDFLDGALDLDGDFGSDLGDVDVGLDGGADADFGDVDGGDVDGGDADSGDGGRSGGLRGLLQVLGLTGVPLPVILSVLILLAWTLTFLMMDFLDSGLALAELAWDVAEQVGVGRGGLGALASALASVVSVVGTRFIIRPLRPVFVSQSAKSNRELVGKLCTVTTARVDEGFGQAEAMDDGMPLLIQVRCRRENDLTRGSSALIFDYDREEGVFDVAPFDPGAGPDEIAREVRTIREARQARGAPAPAAARAAPRSSREPPAAGTPPEALPGRELAEGEDGP